MTGRYLTDDPTGDYWTMIRPRDSPVSVRWVHNERPVQIECRPAADDAHVVVRWTLQVDGYVARVPTTERVVSTDAVSETIADIASDIDDATGPTPLGADEHTLGFGDDDSDVTLVHVYCVFPDELPDGVSPDDIELGGTSGTDADAGGETDADTSTGDDEAAIEPTSALDLDPDEHDAVPDDRTIRVDTYPVLEANVVSWPDTTATEVTDE